MTQRQPSPAEEIVSRVASLLAQALTELQQQSPAWAAAEAARQELAASRAGLQELASHLERQLADEKEQRLVLANQLTGLAASLDRLVDHLHGLSQLIADLLERLAAPAPAASPPGEQPFRPGGEGVSLTLTGVPGFQALMDTQKALMSLEPVGGASVERFQEGDSRILLNLRAPITATELADALRKATNHAFIVEESRPDLLRLRLKIVPAS